MCSETCSALLLGVAFVLYLNNPNQCSGAGVLASLLSLMYSDGLRSSYLELLRLWFGEQDVGYTLWPRDGDIPLRLYARKGNAILILTGGVQSYRMGSSFFRGYQRAEADRLKLFFHPVAWYAADQISTDLFNFFGRDEEVHCTFGGHSSGGAIAAVLCCATAVLRPRATCKAYTFGAPKCNNCPGDIQFGGDPQIGRYYMPRDPVPFVVPSSNEVNAVTYNYGRLIGVEGNSWRHAGAGLNMRDDGVLLQQYSADPLDNPPTIGIAGWATGLLAGSERAHLVSRYRDWLARFIPDAVRVPEIQIPDRPLAPAALDPPAPLPFDPFKAGRVPPPPLTTTPPVEGGPSPDGDPFYTLKVNRQWWVYHWADPIELCSSWKTARRRASEMNRVVARFNASAAGDKAALVAAFDDELAD